MGAGKEEGTREGGRGKWTGKAEGCRNMWRGNGGEGEGERKQGWGYRSWQVDSLMQTYFLILEWQGSSCTEVVSSTWMVCEKHPSNSCTTIAMGP